MIVITRTASYDKRKFFSEMLFKLFCLGISIGKIAMRKYNATELIWRMMYEVGKGKMIIDIIADVGEYKELLAHYLFIVKVKLAS